MPLFHALPGKVIIREYPAHCLEAAGFHEEDVIHATSRSVEQFVDSKKQHFVLTAGLQTSMHAAWKWGLPYSNQFITLRGGNDEDHFWNEGARSHGSDKVEQSARFPTLLNTKYVQQNCRRSSKAWSHRILPDRKTIFYLATRPHGCSDVGFISPPPGRHCQEGRFPSKVVLQGLVKLAQQQNVIVRPHPADIDHYFSNPSFWQNWCPGCILDDYRDGYSFFDTATLADVIIGEPSAVTSGVVYHAAEKGIPMIYLLRDFSLYLCLRKKVLNTSMAYLFFPDFSHHWKDFVDTVKKVQLKQPRTALRLQKAYFEALNGPIDGYEEYRVATALLKGALLGQGDDLRMAQELARLEHLLANISNLSLDLKGIQLPVCEEECCQRASTDEH
eukprot:TRINITY_DN94753_c0_g1_i1.p1 TRINITY_DN94753_c0_g1~~TRINITY_DN94753_c0_g1_i1.p1  ORF type:complete len:388 (+),score=47.65 TRINITY_DN94753_c0_g1_i1:273-1436(+)